MKLRCPYCKTVLEGDPKPQCTECGKTMMMPKRLIDSDKTDTKKIREAIVREGEMKKKALGLGDVQFAAKPSGVIIAVVMLSFAGILLLSKAKAPQAAGIRKTPAMEAANDLGVLSIALNRFKADIGRYPTTEEGLQALINNPGLKNWPRAYVNLIRPDPWHKHYVYSSNEEVFILLSMGPDKMENTADDIYPPIVTDPLQERDTSTTIPEDQQELPPDRLSL